MIVSKCFCAAPHVFVMLPSARFLIGYCLVSRNNLQIKPVFVLGVPPTQQDFWSDSRLGRLRRSSERIQSLLTHLTPQENLIRSSLEPSRWSGHCLGLSEGEKSSPNQPDYLVVCTQHKQRRIRYISVCDIDKIWHLNIFWDFIDNDNQMIFCYDLQCVAPQACRGPLTPKVYEFLCGAQFTAVTEMNLFQQV